MTKTEKHKCEECKREFNTPRGLAQHIGHMHKAEETPAERLAEYLAAGGKGYNIVLVEIAEEWHTSRSHPKVFRDCGYTPCSNFTPDTRAVYSEYGQRNDPVEEQRRRDGISMEPQEELRRVVLGETGDRLSAPAVVDHSEFLGQLIDQLIVGHAVPLLVKEGALLMGGETVTQQELGMAVGLATRISRRLAK